MAGLDNLMIYEGVSFNAEWARTKTEREFISEFINVHYQSYSRKDRVQLLKQAYWLLVSNGGSGAQ